MSSVGGYSIDRWDVESAEGDEVVFHVELDGLFVVEEAEQRGLGLDELAGGGLGEGLGEVGGVPFPLGVLGFVVDVRVGVRDFGGEPGFGATNDLQVRGVKVAEDNDLLGVVPEYPIPIHFTTVINRHHVHIKRGLAIVRVNGYPLLPILHIVLLVSQVDGISHGIEYLAVCMVDDEVGEPPFERVTELLVVLSEPLQVQEGEFLEGGGDLFDLAQDLGGGVLAGGEEFLHEGGEEGEREVVAVDLLLELGAVEFVEFLEVGEGLGALSGYPVHLPAVFLQDILAVSGYRCLKLLQIHSQNTLRPLQSALYILLDILLQPLLRLSPCVTIPKHQ